MSERDCFLGGESIRGTRSGTVCCERAFLILRLVENEVIERRPAAFHIEASAPRPRAS